MKASSTYNGIAHSHTGLFSLFRSPLLVKHRLYSMIFCPPKHHAGIHHYALFLRPSYLTKVSYLAAFFSLILLLWQRNMKVLSVCISTGLIFVSGGLFSWGLSVFLVSNFNGISKIKLRDKRNNYTFAFLISCILILFSFYYIFYKITAIEGRNHYDMKNFDFYTSLKSVASFEFIKRELIYLGSLFFSILPWGLVVFLFTISRRISIGILLPGMIRKGLIFFIILFAIGGVSSFILREILVGNTDQLARFSFLPLYVVILVLISINFRMFPNILKIICYIIVLLDLYHSVVILNTHNIVTGPVLRDTTFSDSFFEKVRLQDQKSKVGGHIQNTSSNKYPDFFTTAFQNFFIYELTVLPNYYGFVSLFDDEINWDSTDAGQNATRNILFYLNYKQRPENKGLTRDQVRFKLVQEYKLDWVVTDPGMALPSYLKPHRRSKVCDPKTGFCIHYLNLKSLLAAPLPADTTIRDATSNPEPMPRTPAGAADSRAG